MRALASTRLVSLTRRVKSRSCVGLLLSSFMLALASAAVCSAQDRQQDTQRAKPHVEHISQPKHDKTPTIVLIMESSAGLRAAAELRQALRGVGCVALSITEAERQAIDPDAYLVVASDHSRVIHVRYWDRSGRSDSLSAIAPPAATAEQMAAVTLALSTAMVERHTRDVPPVMGPLNAEIRSRAGMFDVSRDSQAIYAMLGRLSRLSPRTNVQLRFEDF